MSISVIVLNYGSAQLTEQCLESLAKYSPDIEVVVVDNMPPKPNLGFAAGCNAGAGLATGETLVFLNNDTRVREGWLEPLEMELAEPTVGAVGPLLLYPDNTVQCAGVEVDFAAWGNEARNITRFWTFESEDVSAVTGACLAIRRDVFDEVDGFDEGYWNGYEDVDLCLKLRLAGYRIRFTPYSQIVHYESQSDPAERFRKVQDNIRRLNEKWGELWQSLTVTPTSPT